MLTCLAIEYYREFMLQQTCLQLSGLSMKNVFFMHLQFQGTNSVHEMRKQNMTRARRR